MSRAIIFANGRMDKPQNLNPEFVSSSKIICADGGLKNCLQLGIQPHIIIGDLDSVQVTELDSYHARGVAIIQYPTHKEETDLELALHYAVENGFDDVTILGALGARWDMTIANILLLADPKFNLLKLRLLDGTQELVMLRPGNQLVFDGKPGDTLSLIPLAGDTRGVSTRGLEYPLKGETLYFGASRGVSNVFTHKRASVTLGEGLLLCVIDRVANVSDIS